MLRLIVGACVLAFASVAGAQTIYEPVQYQYGTGSTFYYGGSDRAVIERGTAETKGYCGQRGYTGTPTLIYCDAAPTYNARVLGMTVDDARNEAYGNVPRFFRMRDARVNARVEEDGTVVVPAQGRKVERYLGMERHTMTIVPSRKWPATKATTKGTTGPVIVIPKDMMDRPVLKKKELVAMAGE
jgi:hypothetical protein